MIAIDSSALVAVLTQEPDADRFNRMIGAAEAVFMSAISLLETSQVLAGPRGGAERWSRLDEYVARLRITVLPFDAEQVEAAREAFLRYGKGRHPARLNMGDCASYALAKTRNLPLLFKGDDFSRTDIPSAA